MPYWVLSKLESIVFWSGNHDLVARKVVVGTSLVFFLPEIYNFVGSSAVLPELLQSLDQSALSTVQFLQNGAV